MNLVLSEHFGREERSRHSEWLRKRQWFIKAKTLKEEKQKIDAELNDELASFATSLVAATPIEIEAFDAKLDTYDESIVIALMENQERLDEIETQLADANFQIQALLDQALVMEDGRRVFLTKDRIQAFDEFGAEVSNDEFDFSAAPENAPSYEIYKSKVERRNELTNEREALTAERKEILEFQDKVDVARESFADGDVSKAELDDLDGELAEAMPESVKAHVPSMTEKMNAPKLSSECDAQAKSSSESVIMRNNSIIGQPGLDFCG